LDLRYDIIIGGMGGQGIILAGLILGTAATVYAGKNAVQIQSYGPEARGGRVRSEIAISDEEIDCPKAEYVDIGVFMSQLSYQTYSWRVKSKGIIIYDPDLVEVELREEIKFYGVPATRIAEELGNRLSANMVMLGALVAITKILEPDTVEKAIISRVPRFKELNLQAFRAGYDYGLKLLGEVF